MHFNRLRLSGFKSFVEPTELHIEPGLTGVVGPNGCGKSNLLEGLRWVMGESSYKRMRASGMDDVIFSGSANRPERNMAEVTIVLDNASRTAPPAFNDADALEISRRIEREAGSAYRINGKDVRAKDVQLLFADASTGSRSPALVRQGQIGEIVNAKPQARRRILEEAAGITGLYTRRHEAELRLNAAETNLTRLEDVVGQLEVQLGNLKRQARQASRYKNISGDIRKAEASQLYIQWHGAAEALEEAEKGLRESQRALAEHTRLSAEASRLQTEASEKVPPLREQEMVKAAVLQRLTVEREGLEAEERRAEERKNELESRLRQITQDLEREREFTADTEGVLTRLASEEDALKAADLSEEDARSQAEAEVASAAESLRQVESRSDEAAAALSALQARRSTLERTASDLRSRLGRMEAELTSADDQLAVLAEARASSAAMETVNASAEAAQSALSTAELSVEQADGDHKAKRETEAQTRQDHEQARRDAERLATEVATLEKVLSVQDGELWPPLIDAVTAASGFEAALGAALGDDLDVPADEAAPVHWRTLEALSDAPALPGGVTPLSAHVDAPAALARRLAQVGIVDREQGKALQSQLRTGQRLVSKAGDLWRWDGFTAAADAPTAAAQRLAERNRLTGLRIEAEGAAASADKARSAFEEAQAAVRRSEETLAEARNALREANRSLSDARDAQAAQERADSEANAQRAVLEETHRRLSDDIAQLKENLHTAQADFDALPVDDELQAELGGLREKVTAERAQYTDVKAKFDGFERDARLRTDRLQAIAEERDAWRERSERAGAQIAALETRSEEATADLAKLSDLPQQWTERREKLFRALGQAEEERKAAADALAEAESHLSSCNAQAKEAETTLSGTREAHARIEERLHGCRERIDDVVKRIEERLECPPQQAREMAGLKEDQELPDAEAIDKRLTRLRAERERLGGVNLRADEEAQEVGEQLDTLVSEREDLIKAIHRLRQGIASLNKEGRERLVGAFDKVNEHFEHLFTTLFGGGKASLEFVESEDPLEAGLEINARPPGKRTQVLSLLSGGEQALTAMALIFAVFMTNPSPICVLDEVDAPLDDANVERFCALLREMESSTDTRFLIITHHPYTMSQMNRLFGVTMAERGVSQLVSVDLETAESYREAS